MKHLKKYNENVNQSITTWSELLSRIDSGETKLIGTKKEYIEKHLQDLSKWNKRDFSNDPIASLNGWGGIKDGMSSCDERFVFVYDDNNLPVAIISQYELVNPFVFGDIVICPGHDSITCYNKVTGESKTSHIR